MSDFSSKEFADMERQELNYQDKVMEQNSEMTDFLNQFPVIGKRELDHTLSVLEENVNAIRTHLESKPKKVTMKELSEKIDLILKILVQNGMVCSESDTNLQT